MTDLSVIVVNWNGGEDLAACVSSVPAAAEGLTYEVLVVDNGSTDGSVEEAARRFPAARLVLNATNRGFSGGVNEGIARAAGAAILILNPDITLLTGTLCPLVTYMKDHPGVGAVGAALRGPDGSRQHGYLRKLPTLAQVLLFHTVLEPWARRRVHLVSRYLEENPEGEGISQVEQLPGAFLLTTRAVIGEVGFFDERFKLFYEDVDWCLRVRKAGYELLLHNGVNALHRGGGTFNGEARDWVQGRLALSLMFYFDLHKGRKAAWTVRAILVLNALLVALVRSIQLIVPGRHRSLARRSRNRALYFLRIVFATYLLHRNAPLNPSVAVSR